MAPRLALIGDRVALSWLEKDPTSAADHPIFSLKLAIQDGDRFGQVVTVHRGPGFFANWADTPSLFALRPSKGAPSERLIAAWLAMLGSGTYSYGIQTAFSHDGGRTWGLRGLLHDDASPTEHGFVAFTGDPTGKSGAGVAFWLDGRAMLAGEDSGHDHDHGQNGSGSSPGAMHLRLARFDAEGRVGSSILLDDRVCECCQTSAAWTDEGPIVAYRDRSDAEVRDIAVLRVGKNDELRRTLVHADGYKTFACPVNGPALAAAGRRVALAWFTEAKQEPKVKIAWSEDAGATFGAPIVIDEALPLGRVDLALDQQGAAYVTWLRQKSLESDGAELRVVRVEPNGKFQPAQVIATTSKKRSSGVPRLIHDGKRLVVVWIADHEVKLAVSP